MSKYESRETLAAKIAWEGGVWAWVTGYGFDPEDMPDDETRVAAVAFNDLLIPAWQAANAFMDLLPDMDNT